MNPTAIAKNDEIHLKLDSVHKDSNISAVKFNKTNGLAKTKLLKLSSKNLLNINGMKAYFGFYTICHFEAQSNDL